MIVLVSDTSILIDLERGGLLERVFGCGLTMVVPDLLYENELESENGPYLKALGLIVIELHPDEVAVAQAIRRDRKALSLPDCFALSCAARPNHILVTGDNALRQEANARATAVHGLLWILDQMADSGTIPRSALAQGLDRIVAHPRCRLPGDEVRKRIALWT